MNPHNQEIFITFCSILSKKIRNPTSPLLILESAQTILTPTENHLLCLQREFRRWMVQMQSELHNPCIPFIYNAFLPINFQYKLHCGCWLVASCITCCTGQGKIKNFALVATKNRFWTHHFSTQETVVHIIQRRNQSRIQWHRQQSIFTSSKHIFVVRNGRSYTTHECGSQRFTLYTKTRVLVLSIPTHKCVHHQTLAKG